MSDENDFCCGNGCANCVLNEKPKAKIDFENCGKRNILENFTKFTLKSKTKHENLDKIYELHFISCLPQAETTEYVLNIPSGHHVMMKAPVNVTENNDIKKLLRPYSPFWTNFSTLEFKILVNLQPDGPMSSYISRLHVEDEVEFRGPIGGHYTHTATLEDTKRLVIISQGVAIAPTLPIIQEILDNEDDYTRISHFACFRNLEHAYFRKRLSDFNKYWNYDVRIYLARQQCGSELCLKSDSCVENCAQLSKKMLYKEKIFTQRLNGEELFECCNANGTCKTSFVICGSRSFQDKMENTLKSLDLQVEYLFIMTKT